MSREGVLKLFKKIDNSNDGTLNKVEVKKMLMLILKKTSDEIENDEILKYFSQNDKDKDGKISFDEFYSAFNKRDNKDVTKAELRDQFNRIDKDGDGQIDANEAEVLLCNCEGYDEEKAREYMAKVDTDKNGKINFAEFMADFYKD